MSTTEKPIKTESNFSKMFWDIHFDDLDDFNDGYEVNSEGDSSFIESEVEDESFCLSISPGQINNKSEVFIGKSLFDQLETFLSTDELTDVIVKVGEETFPCHKIILASWCPYFRGLFASGMLESQKGVVELSTLESDDFVNLLKIMYTGLITVDADNLEGLIFGSSYLQSKSIQTACTEFIISSLSRTELERNFKYLKMCRILDLRETAEKILNFMLEYFDSHVESDEYANLAKEDIEYIIATDRVPFKITEDNVCDAILKWLSCDIDCRRQYVKPFLFRLRYLALSEKYMKNEFLDHSVLQELDSKDRIELVMTCRNYLQNILNRDEVIGQPEACHRQGSHLKDVIVVLYCSKFACFVPEGTTTPKSIYKPWYDIPMPTELLLHNNITSLTACNYGRSEMYISTGTSMFHFNGMTGIWKKCASSVIQKTNNCLVLDTRFDSLYSVTSKMEGVFIEKYVVSHSSKTRWQLLTCGAFGLNKKDIEAVQSESLDKYQSWSNKTCAFMLNQNLFFLHSTEKSLSEGGNTAVFAFNTELQTLSYITCLPVVGTCIMAVRWSNLMFLIDQDCKNVLRVSNNGFNFDQYGEIGHDSQPTDLRRSNFGLTYWNGKLIMVGGACFGCSTEDNRGYLQYDLDSHRTQKVPWGLDYMYPGRAHSLKLTVDVKHLKPN